MKPTQLFQMSMLAVCFSLLSVICFAQASEQWIKRYDGPSGGYDYTTALVADDSGNVYVTGQSETGAGSDLATIKYDATGKALWISRYNGPKGLNDVPYSMVVDGSGNVYVTGSSDDNMTTSKYTTLKYNAAGKQLWVRQYGNGVATSVAVDASGNVYVTGYSVGSSGTYDYATIKYDPNGTELWVRQYNGVGNLYDAAVDVALDRSGNVFITGYSDGKYGFPDYTTIAYDKNGTQRWVRRYDSGDRDFAASLVTDKQGNVYVTGDSHAGEDASNYTTLKYDAAGSLLWKKTYTNGSSPRLALDDSGSVYIAATGRKDGGFAEYVTSKLHTDGSQAWVKRYNGAGGYDDIVGRLAIDKAGNVYVTGSSAGSLGISEYATVKYNSNGMEQWVKRFSGSSENADVATSIAVDSSSDVYVTGGSQNTRGDFDFATIKYTQAQTLTIASFSLINTDTDNAIATLKNGDTINLASLPSLHLNIRANTSPAVVGSIVFQLRGAEWRTHTENLIPYALFADNTKGHFYSWIPTNGNYTLTATPYNGVKGSGNAGKPLTIQFTVTGTVVRSLILVNAETDQDIKPLKNGDVIDLSALPTTKLNIRAVVHPDTIGSVVFNLNDWMIVRENLVPYAIGGDIKGNFRAWSLPAGNQVLTASPYDGPRGSGKKGKPLRVAFTVINPLPPLTNTGTKPNRLIADAAVSPKAGNGLSVVPNPFVTQTLISFSVPESGQTLLEVYDMKGTRAARLYNTQAEKGKTYQVQFESKSLPSGVYMLLLRNGTIVQSCKLVLVR